jgi:hypothetical protein
VARVLGPVYTFMVVEPARSSKGEREPFVELRFPADAVPPVTRVRSTLVASSVRELGRIGRLAEYQALLPVHLHPVILGTLAGSWLDVDVVAEHYRAVAALDMPVTQQLALGKAVGSAMHGYLIGPTARDQKANRSPWTVLRNARRTWDRIYVGGDVSVDKVGPTEAIRTMYGLSLNNIPYVRNATRALLQVGLSSWCEKCVVSEIEWTPALLEFRISWV